MAERRTRQGYAKRPPRENATVLRLSLACTECGTRLPFALHLSPGAIDRMPMDLDSSKAWVLSVWTHVVQERCRKQFECPCHYRRVRYLPDLRPWQG